MNYIFLDVDGVLNNRKHYKKQHEKYGGRFICENMPFNPRSLKNLRKIIDKTAAKIVISSSWRRSTTAMAVLEARLIEYGIKIHSTTPKLQNRKEEILEWCKQNMKSADKYIIIDDELYNMLEHWNYNTIIKIDSYRGLTRLKVYEAIKKLNKVGD